MIEIKLVLLAAAVARDLILSDGLQINGNDNGTRKEIDGRTLAPNEMEHEWNIGER